MKPPTKPTRQPPQPVTLLTPADLPPNLPDRKRAEHPVTRRKLRSLKAAELPRDYYPAHFDKWDSLFRLTPEGLAVCEQWSRHVAAGGKLPNLPNRPYSPPPAVFLPLLQVHLLKAENAKLLSELHPPPSPKWDVARNEISPARRARLTREAQQEDDAASAGKTGLRSLLPYTVPSTEPRAIGLASYLKLLKGRPDQDYTPDEPQIRLWFEPMTVEEYRFATATSRTTIGKFLNRTPKAAPINPDKGANEPYQYGPDTNYRVLGQWLARWVRNPAHARIYGAATAAFCSVHARDRFKQFFGDVLDPVLRERCYNEDLDGRDGAEFMEAFDDHVRFYAPPSASGDPFAAILHGASPAS